MNLRNYLSKIKTNNNLSVYLVRILAALVQITVVFFLSSIELETLGIYSFFTALAAITCQTCNFEGHQHVLTKSLDIHKLKRYYLLSFSIWLFIALSLLIVTFYLEKTAVIFLSIFLLSVTLDWSIHLKTLEDRLKENDFSFQRLTKFKGLVVDLFLPGLCILVLILKPPLMELILFLPFAFFLLSIFDFYKTLKVNILEFPHYSLWIGVTFKRLDSVLIRIFVGYFWGYQILGYLQPVLSMGRVVALLTPYWINLNLNTVFNKIDTKSLDYFKLLIFQILSYFIYFAFAILSYYLYYNLINTPNEYEFIVFLVIFFWFGTQNTKAFVRVLSISDLTISFNNGLTLFGVILKFLLSFFISEENTVHLVFLYLAIDLLLVLTLLISFSPKVKRGKF
tara:strand:- start:10878 stop:12062 length:1185 start_codon:yes stop_codon:yes gene_type:complete